MVKETVKVTRVSLAMLTAFGAMVAAGCGSDNDVNAVLVGTFVTVNAGSNGQTATAGTQLPLPISVHVTDQNSNALAGVSVAWAVVGAGGSVSTASSLTDANGDAVTNWTLGPAVALDSLTASIASGASVTITATATAVGSTISKISGDNQALIVGQNSAPMVVRILNGAGAAIGGAAVNWTVDNGGTLSAVQSITDANGNTSVTLVGAPAGTTTITATGPSGAQQAFTITAGFGH